MKRSLPIIVFLLLTTWLAAQTKQKTMTFVVGDCKFDMVWVQGGSFMMGCEPYYNTEAPSTATFAGVHELNPGKYDEFPSHAVRLDNYYLGRYEVTQRLWETVMGYNPSNFKGDDLPKE